MRPVFSACILAIAAAASAAGQQVTSPAPGQQARPVAKAEEGRQIVTDGCLTGGPSSFTLSNVAVAPPVHPRPEVPVGTAGTAVTSYSLRGRDGVNLASYVGKKVEIRGVLLTPEAGTPSGSGSGEKPKRDDSPDVKADSHGQAGPAAAARRPNVAVTEVRVLSDACR